MLRSLALQPVSLGARLAAYEQELEQAASQLVVYGLSPAQSRLAAFAIIGEDIPEAEYRVPLRDRFCHDSGRLATERQVTVFDSRTTRAFVAPATMEPFDGLPPL